MRPLFTRIIYHKLPDLAGRTLTLRMMVFRHPKSQAMFPIGNSVSNIYTQGIYSPPLQAVNVSNFLNGAPSTLYSSIPAAGPLTQKIPTAVPSKSSVNFAPGRLVSSIGTSTKPGRVSAASRGVHGATNCQPLPIWACRISTNLPLYNYMHPVARQEEHEAWQHLWQ